MTNDERKIISNIFEELIKGTKAKIESETITTILENRTPVTVQLFSKNISDYLYFVVCQRVTTSFSTRLGKVMEKLCEELVKFQGGSIIKKPKPYDLKFKLKDGKEYWIELKSIDGQNSSNKQTIEERKKYAEKRGKIFKLCIYNDETKFKEDYKLNGKDFWDFILGEKNAQEIVFSIINGIGVDFSIKKIIDENYSRLLKEYKNKNCV